MEGVFLDPLEEDREVRRGIGYHVVAALQELSPVQHHLPVLELLENLLLGVAAELTGGVGGVVGVVGGALPERSLVGGPLNAVGGFLLMVGHEDGLGKVVLKVKRRCVKVGSL